MSFTEFGPGLATFCDEYVADPVLMSFRTSPLEPSNPAMKLVSLYGIVAAKKFSDAEPEAKDVQSSPSLVVVVPAPAAPTAKPSDGNETLNHGIDFLVALNSSIHVNA